MTATEQMDLLARLGEALTHGWTGFDISDAHGHFHFVRRQAFGPPRLITGATDPLLPLLARSIDGAAQVDLAVAFALDSGVRLLEPWLRDLLNRGGRLRVVVGDYMDVTEPAALRRLEDLEGADLRIFETGTSSFHPKAWLFRAADRTGSAIVGSSNLSRTALTTGVEWNLHSENATDVVQDAFESLLSHPSARVLTSGWIDAYAVRRGRTALTDIAQTIVADEPPDPAPRPHPIQQAALDALGATRRAGRRKGLVVLATGLGKTWLAAFDSLPFQRVLFVAHREEILNQAMSSFRRIRPEARFGRYDGNEKNTSAEVLFASIQTIGRKAHLHRFDPNAFDYIVVDEFHHASAASYRGLLDHFSPSFLLGLTATPDRADGESLLELCDENLVYQCDLFEGIEAGLLAPFQYLGVPDEVDYAQIPWRSSQFDPTALDAAIVTEARAANALEQFNLHREGPAIGFCCSVRHAEFMADFFQRHGIKAVAVHSGPGSAPRTTSLEQLGRGEIDILFAVDMFNEGVDVPNIGTVMMLRPTESAIIWLQQLGRGLRRVEGKLLRVIDYIGNHRIFLTKLRALLGAGPGYRSLSQRLEEAFNNNLSLPAGCSVTYDLEVVEILRALLRKTPAGTDLEMRYRDFHLRHERRPTAAEIAAEGFDPSRNGHGGWFDFVRDMGDPVDDRAMMKVAELLRTIERDAALDVSALMALSSINGAPASQEGLARWAFHPLVKREDQHLSLIRDDPGGKGARMIQELVAWRLSILKPDQVDESPAPTSVAGPGLWIEYMREQIPPLFGAVFNPGNWKSGIVRLERDLILLTTLHKKDMASGNHYQDEFLSPDVVSWQSQSRTRRDSKVGRILLAEEPDVRVHLFVRANKLRNGKAAPFLYCGRPQFDGADGEQPITIQWRLAEQIPRHFWGALGIV
ncbi:DUF3427 domain-containing protein [Paracoccus sp. JM45]|nr:DUF3427 domain-containing protein [Paracoccus sp. JM45]